MRFGVLLVLVVVDVQPNLAFSTTVSAHVAFTAGTMCVDSIDIISRSFVIALILLNISSIDNFADSSHCLAF